MLIKKLAIIAFLALFTACQDALVDPVADSDTGPLETAQDCQYRNTPC